MHENPFEARQRGAVRTRKVTVAIASASVLGCGAVALVVAHSGGTAQASTTSSVPQGGESSGQNGSTQPFGGQDGGGFQPAQPPGLGFGGGGGHASSGGS